MDMLSFVLGSGDNSQANNNPNNNPNPSNNSNWTGRVQNFASPSLSAQQANVSTWGNYDRQRQVADDARQQYTNIQDIIDPLEKASERSAEFGARLGKDSMSYRNQIAQDIGRADTFNTLAKKGQEISSSNAQTLANAYTNARASNTQLLSSLYGGSLRG